MITQAALVLIVVWFAPPAAESRNDWALESTAIYGGPSFDAREEFGHAEILANLDTPWAWTSPLGWRVTAQLQLTGGVLWAAGTEAGMLGGGPQVRIDHPEGGLVVTAGSGPLLISESRFDREDLGGPIQFSSHLSIGYAFGKRRHLRLLGRVTHVSNAGLYDENPGVNTYGLVFEYGLPEP